MPLVVRFLSPLYPHYYLTPAYHFHRLPRTWPWHSAWRVRLIRLRFGCWILEYRHVYTRKGAQFKRGGYCWRPHRWNSSNFHPRCRVALLSTTATFTGADLRVRRRHRTTVGSRSSSAPHVGSRDACRDFALRDNDTSEALCIYFVLPNCDYGAHMFS